MLYRRFRYLENLVPLLLYYKRVSCVAYVALVPQNDVDEGSSVSSDENSSELARISTIRHCNHIYTVNTIYLYMSL